MIMDTFLLFLTSNFVLKLLKLLSLVSYSDLVSETLRITNIYFFQSLSVTSKVLPRNQSLSAHSFQLDSNLNIRTDQFEAACSWCNYKWDIGYGRVVFMWTYPRQRISTLAMEELFLCGLIQAKESARAPLDGI
jgi:hypothetical protein